MIPDEKASLEIHKKYKSDEHIVRHCETVTRVAKVLTKRLIEKGVPLDEKAVIAAAMLHDIGRTKTQTVHHGYAGAKIVQSEGVDEKVANIIQKHVGAGISGQEAVSLGFPPGDYIPRTLEERVVCFSDKMVALDKVRPLSEELNRFRKRGHDVKRLEDLKRGLEEVLGEDPEKVIFSNL